MLTQYNKMVLEVEGITSSLMGARLEESTRGFRVVYFSKVLNKRMDSNLFGINSYRGQVTNFVNLILDVERKISACQKELEDYNPNLSIIN